MMEDPSDNLLEGMWPIVKRVVMLLLPIWIFLLAFAANAPLWVASTLAGLSLAPVIVYEKLMLKQYMQDEMTKAEQSKPQR